MSRIFKDSPKFYSWVLTVSGEGHLNMNKIKTLFKILDKIILEPLGKDVLTFNTLKSYQYFTDCKDNHKAWQAFENFLHGTTMELIRLCYLESESPSPLGFLQWRSNIEKLNLKLVCQLRLRVALLIYIQLVGDWNNDSECIEAGRMKFIHTFFSSN